MIECRYLGDPAVVEAFGFIASKPAQPAFASRSEPVLGTEEPLRRPAGSMEREPTREVPDGSSRNPAGTADEHETRVRLRKATGFAHAHCKNEYESFFEFGLPGMVILSPAQGWVKVNRAFREMLGYSEEMLNGTSWVEITHIDDLAEDFAHFERLWNGEIDAVRFKKRFVHRNGQLIYTDTSVRALRNPQGDLLRFLVTVSDITQEVERRQNLERLAYYDYLTQLPNRALFADRLRMSRTQRSKRQLAVCYLDLDDFKLINDTFGHETGDRLLVEVARRLREELREGDTVARLGGDEFALLLNDIGGPADCRETVARIFAALAKPFPVVDDVVPISASIGVTLFAGAGDDDDGLLRQADQALYLAKRAGRNQCWLFDGDSAEPLHASGERMRRE